MPDTPTPANNPHMWIPYHGPEPYDEVCHLCGVFSGAHQQQPEPPASKLPCPEPWPQWPDDEQRAYDTGWNLREMGHLDMRDSYKHDAKQRRAFEAGWADAEVWITEKQRDG